MNPKQRAYWGVPSKRRLKIYILALVTAFAGTWLVLHLTGNSLPVSRWVISFVVVVGMFWTWEMMRPKRDDSD